MKLEELENRGETRVYTNLNGKSFILEFQNDHPYQKYESGKGWIKGEYSEPQEVVLKKK